MRGNRLNASIPFRSELEGEVAISDLSGIPGSTPSLVERAKAILLQTKETWPVIATERTTPGNIITRYAIPLAAIGPVAGFIGGQVFGYSAIFATYRPGLMAGLSMAITTFIMAIVAGIDPDNLAALTR
jgi:hypothetical protein